MKLLRKTNKHQNGLRDLRHTKNRQTHGWEAFSKYNGTQFTFICKYFHLPHLYVRSFLLIMTHFPCCSGSACKNISKRSNTNSLLDWTGSQVRHKVDEESVELKTLHCWGSSIRKPETSELPVFMAICEDGIKENVEDSLKILRSILQRKYGKKLTDVFYAAVIDDKTLISGLFLSMFEFSIIYSGLCAINGETFSQYLARRHWECRFGSYDKTKLPFRFCDYHTWMAKRRKLLYNVLRQLSKEKKHQHLTLEMSYWHCVRRNEFKNLNKESLLFSV